MKVLDLGQEGDDLVRDVTHDARPGQGVLHCFAGLDDVPLDQVHAWEEAFLRFIHEERNSIWQEITDSRQLDDKTAAQLDQALAEFQKVYTQHKEEATATV